MPSLNGVLGRRLARLDPVGYYVLHDRALPDDSRPVANLDHLVVGLSGVYAVASRRLRLGARLGADQRGLPVAYTSAQVATIAAAAERVLPPMMEILIPE